MISCKKSQRLELLEKQRSSACNDFAAQELKAFGEDYRYTNAIATAYGGFGNG